jgi:6-phosphofructokinase 1
VLETKNKTTKKTLLFIQNYFTPPRLWYKCRNKLEIIKRTHDKYGWVSIVCGEGICYADGTHVSSASGKDKFGNVEFGAMAGTTTAFVLQKMIQDTFGWRGEFQITESLQMCSADRAVQQDYEEAYACGKRAVELALAGTGGDRKSVV